MISHALGILSAIVAVWGWIDFTLLGAISCVIGVFGFILYIYEQFEE